MRCKTLTIVFWALLISFCGASAQTPTVDVAGSYLCISDFAGGVSFRDQDKKWHGTSFAATERFILALTKVGTTRDEYGIPVQDYNATVTPVGKSFAQPCRGRSTENNGASPIWLTDGLLVCTTYETVQVNLGNLRFLTFYEIGYVDGADNNDNTPSISGGLCTKLP